MRLRVYFIGLAISSLVVATGCEHSTTAPSLNAETIVGYEPELDDIENLEDVQNEILAIAELESGGQIEFVKMPNGLLYLPDGEDAQAALSAAREMGLRDPVSVFELVSGTGSAPHVLLEFMEEAGIERQIFQKADLSINTYNKPEYDDPVIFSNKHSGMSTVRTEQTGSKTYYWKSLAKDLMDANVYSVRGKIRVRVYERYWHALSLSYKYRRVVDRDISAGSYLSVFGYFWTAQRWKLRISEATDNLYHYAVN